MVTPAKGERGITKIFNVAKLIFERRVLFSLALVLQANLPERFRNVDYCLSESGLDDLDRCVHLF